LSITPLQASVGEFHETIELEAVAADGRVLATQLVGAEGRTIEPVELLPRVTDLGPLPVGSRTRTRVAVAAHTGGDVEILEVNSPDPAVRGIASRPQQPPSVEFESVIRALGYGESNGTIRVRQGGSTSYVLPYRLRWYGVRPEGEK